MPRETQVDHQQRSNSSSSSDPSPDSTQSYEVKPPHHASTMPVSMVTPARPHQVTLSPYSTLYLTIHSALNKQFKSNRAYCKTFVANMPMVENTMFAHFSNNQFQSFKTDIVQVDNNIPVWNAKYQIRINDPKVEVLSILVKTKQLLCSPIVGVCVINLKTLIDAGHVNQWFALRKGQFNTGRIHLQMQLQKIEQPSISLRYKTDNSPEFVSTHTHQPFPTGPYASQPTYTSTPIGALPPRQPPSNGNGIVSELHR